MKNSFVKYIRLFLVAFILFFGINWFLSDVLKVDFYSFINKKELTQNEEPTTPFYTESTPRSRSIATQNGALEANAPTLFTLQDAYNEVADKAIAAVVSLQVESERQVNNNFGNDEFLRRFFGLPNNPQRRKASSFGSGFLISADGFLLSNFHVVENATKIEIVFKDSDKKYTASIIGSDQDTDIALLKIDSKETFPFLTLANSQAVKIGDIVIAIGNPFGLSHTFTTGVVSAKGRTGVIGNRYENFIQTDVAINPGNSGGPLLNLYGEVVGINSAIFSQSGGSIGIGFSIPINMAKNILNQLKNDGKVTRGWIGINFEEVNEDVAEALGIEPNGVVISRILEDSPVSKANVKAGDILTKFDGKAIKDGRDLINKVGNMKIGQKVTLELLRNGKVVKTTIIIEERDETVFNPSRGSGPTGGIDEYFGIEVINMNKDSLEKYKVTKPIGVMVSAMMSDSPLTGKGLKVGDIIKSINKVATLSTNDYKKAAESIKKGQKVLFTIQRESGVSYIVISL